MTSQLTVRLPEELKHALDMASRKLNRKPSELVRMALREFLRVAPDERRRPAERVRGLLGSLESGIPDLAEHQREHLLESLKRAR
jgi:metal-responsive CopG/Arc/MetJ family transcriptional regulator